MVDREDHRSLPRDSLDAVYFDPAKENPQGQTEERAEKMPDHGSKV
jgi:hypothetical protein